MMSKIKSYLLSFYAKRINRKRKQQDPNVGFEQAKTIGILYQDTDLQKEEAIQAFARTLKGLGKKVAVLYCVTRTENTTNSSNAVMLNDFNLWGASQHPAANRFMNTPFDYLYQVDLEGSPVIDYLLAKSKAKCRVGYYTPARTALFELMITLTPGPKKQRIQDLIAQMLHYTQLLKTT